MPFIRVNPWLVFNSVCICSRLCGRGRLPKGHLRFASLGRGLSFPFLFLPAPSSKLLTFPMGNTPYRCIALATSMITAVTTMTAMHDELRDLHAARFAEIAALREMLVDAGTGEHSAEIAGLMRDSVAEILRLQKIIALIEE